jgi:hypothetical protein
VPLLEAAPPEVKVEPTDGAMVLYRPGAGVEGDPIVLD